MNKKLIALLVAAGIMTGVGGFGTYAYFTDAAKVDDEVNITMGDVNVEAWWSTDSRDTTKWTATSSATEVANKTSDTLTFENAKPGDTFERTILVANYGSLKSDVSVAFNPDLNKIMKVELTNVSSQYGNVQKDPNVANRYYENGLLPGSWIKATVKVTISKDAGNEYMKQVFSSDPYTFINVNAHQTIY